MKIARVPVFNLEWDKRKRNFTSQPAALGIRGSAGLSPLAVPMAGATDFFSLRCLPGFVNSHK